MAEDNKTNQILIQKLLFKLGYESDLVENGVQAVAQAQLKRYDLILMDLQMPEMGGLEATRQIRSVHPCASVGCTIVALTANAFQEDREQCEVAGMDDFISKPIDPRRLKEILQNCEAIGVKR